MRYKIDKRFILIQAIKATIGYIVGLCIVFVFMGRGPNLEFAISSICGGALFFAIMMFPRRITIDQNSISFKPDHGLLGTKIEFGDIINVEIKECRFFNTLIIVTVSGKEYKIHPYLIKEVYLQLLKNRGQTFI